VAKINSKLLTAACSYGASAQNTHELCAERRLLAQVKRQLQKKQARVTLTRFRRALSTIRIERLRADGSWGCSLPCVMCRRVLEQMDVCVECVVGDEWIKCRAADLPESTVTAFADLARWKK